MKDVKVITKSLVTSRSEYVVVVFIGNDENKHYGTIDKKLIGEDGVTIKPINGMEMLMDDTAGKAIDRRIKSDLMDDYLEQGMGFGTAYNKAFNAGLTEGQIQKMNAMV